MQADDMEPQFFEERRVSWQQDGISLEMTFSEGQISLGTDGGYALRLPLSVWQTAASLIASAAKGPDRRVKKQKMKKPVEVGVDPTYPNQGQPWTAVLDVELRNGWNGGKTVGQLAKTFGRSGGGIASRLVKLGIVEKREDARARKESHVPPDTPAAASA